MGCLTSCFTDNGPSVHRPAHEAASSGRAFDRICQQQGIRHLLTKPAHPTTDRQDRAVFSSDPARGVCSTRRLHQRGGCATGHRCLRSSTTTTSGRTRPWAGHTGRALHLRGGSSCGGPASDLRRVARAAPPAAPDVPAASSPPRATIPTRSAEPSPASATSLCRSSIPPRPEARQACPPRWSRQGSGSFLRERQPRAHAPRAARGLASTAMQRGGHLPHSKSVDVVGSASVKHEVDPLYVKREVGLATVRAQPMCESPRRYLIRGPRRCLTACGGSARCLNTAGHPPVRSSARTERHRIP